MALSRSDKRDRIIDLFYEGKWRHGYSIGRLAREWGDSDVEVRQLYDEAMRAISLSGGARAGYISQKLAELDGIIEEARGLVKSFLTKDGDILTAPAPDLKAAVQAIRVQLETVGGMELGKAAAKRAAEHGALEEGDEKPYRLLTPAERIAKHEEAIEEERAKLESKH